MQRLYSVLQRYNFESNLQHDMLHADNGLHCIQYYKDTILKAIYNGCRYQLRIYGTVFSITKIQF